MSPLQNTDYHDIIKIERRVLVHNFSYNLSGPCQKTDQSLSLHLEGKRSRFPNDYQYLLLQTSATLPNYPYQHNWVEIFQHWDVVNPDIASQE